MSRYSETYITSDGDFIRSSDFVDSIDIIDFELSNTNKISHITQYIEKDKVVIHMKNGDRYEYEKRG